MIHHFLRRILLSSCWPTEYQYTVSNILALSSVSTRAISLFLATRFLSQDQIIINQIILLQRGVIAICVRRVPGAKNKKKKKKKKRRKGTHCKT